MKESNLYIFLEDKKEKDKQFIEAFIAREFSVKSSRITYIKTNGWAGIKSEAVTQQLQLNSANDIKNLIIFDADNDYKGQSKFVEDHLKSIDCDADIFMFPNNNNNGELETLLMSLANWKDHSFFLECYENYLRCIGEQDLDGAKYRVPDHKDMFQAYSSFFRRGEVDFYDASFWDFSREEAKALRNFLSPHLL